jgi:hypothetical protein
VRQPLTEPSREVFPGEIVACRLAIPPQPPGRYVVELDCVASKVIWFSQVGSEPVRLPVEISAVA